MAGHEGEAVVSVTAPGISTAAAWAKLQRKSEEEFTTGVEAVVVEGESEAALAIQENATIAMTNRPEASRVLLIQYLLEVSLLCVNWKLVY